MRVGACAQQRPSDRHASEERAFFFFLCEKNATFFSVGVASRLLAAAAVCGRSRKECGCARRLGLALHAHTQTNARRKKIFFLMMMTKKKKKKKKDFFLSLAFLSPSHPLVSIVF
jgi:hypothetical protein